MPRSNSVKCSICHEKFDEAQWPLCSYCGAFLVDIDELDLGPTTPIDVIYRKNKEKWSN